MSGQNTKKRVTITTKYQHNELLIVPCMQERSETEQRAIGIPTAGFDDGRTKRRKGPEAPRKKGN